MENQTLLQKIRSVKYCLMAHPHNEPDSEFADRIDDLQEIEDSLEAKVEQPVRKTLDRYDIDFGGNVMAGIEVEGQINIVGAMDGYGNGISLDKIIITPIAQAKAVEPQDGWIKVAPETMPERGKMILGKLHSGERMIRFHDEFRKLEFEYWMYLPE